MALMGFRSVGSNLFKEITKKEDWKGKLYKEVH